MQTLPKDQVASVTAELVKEALIQGEAIAIPGLGTFSVEHRSSRIEERSDGQIIMQPPRDEVIFTPDL